MLIAIARESEANEPRVAGTPETVKKLKALGAEVAVAHGAGVASGIWMPTTRRPAPPSVTT